MFHRQVLAFCESQLIKIQSANRLAQDFLSILDSFIRYFKIVGAISFLFLVLSHRKVLLVAWAVEELLLELVDFYALFTLPFDGHVLHLKLGQRLVGLIPRLVLRATLSLSLNVQGIRTNWVSVVQLERTGARIDFFLLDLLLCHVSFR